MKKSKEKKYFNLADSDIELAITHAFLGASKNLYIIENHFSTIKFISIGQYYNFLSHLAFSIELGLKNIIKNTNKLWAEHDLEKLFIEADEETKNCFTKKFFASYSETFQKDFIILLKNVKYLYIEGRYFYGKSLECFLNDKFITNENMIIFDEIKNNNESFMMLMLLLEELGEYHNFIHKNSVGIIDLEMNLNLKLSDTIKQWHNYTGINFLSYFLYIKYSNKY
jgi:hypothetical protein